MTRLPIALSREIIRRGKKLAYSIDNSKCHKNETETGHSKHHLLMSLSHSSFQNSSFLHTHKHSRKNS